MRKTVYYQRDAADPVLEDGLVLDIVRGYAPGAMSVTGMDDSHGEARAYAVDDTIILKVQRPQQLRSSTSLEKEAFFLRELEAQTDVSVPRVLGYGKRGSVEYICMTRMSGIAAEKVTLSTPEKDALLFELGKELRKIHGIEQKPFEESSLFPRDEAVELTERLQLRYGAALQKKKEGISPDKLALALGEIQTAIQQIRDPDVFVALHTNPYIPHVFVDEATHKYVGIIDFGDAYIGHPIFDMWYWKVESRIKLMRGYTSERPVSAAFLFIFDTVNEISRMIAELR